MDPASGFSQRADYFVVATVGLDTETSRIHLLDVFRERGIPAPEQPAVLEAHYRKWHPRGLPYILIEKVYSQTSLIQYIARRGLIAYKEIDLRKMGSPDKVERAGSLAARYEARQIIHPHTAPWLDAYEDELLAFPNGEHDDMVDAVVYAVDDLILHPGRDGTTMETHEFTYDSTMNRPTDDTGLYAELGIAR